MMIVKKLRNVGLALMLATPLLLGAVPAGASGDVGAAAPRDVLGNWATSAPVSTPTHPAGVNVQVIAVATAQFVGDFAGTTVFKGTFLIDPQGNIRGHATEAFTGTVSGVGSGTVLFEEEATVSAAGVVHVDATITHGSGDLAHLSGRLVFDGTSAADLSSAGTYAGQIQA
jgi:Protein of unknown function (DUF3224)